jgi:hypothetical protein
MAVEVLINQYTNLRRHTPVLVYENNGQMSIYEEKESVQRRNKPVLLTHARSSCLNTISVPEKVSQARSMKEKKPFGKRVGNACAYHSSLLINQVVAGRSCNLIVFVDRGVSFGSYQDRKGDVELFLHEMSTF